MGTWKNTSSWITFGECTEGFGSDTGNIWGPWSFLRSSVFNKLSSSGSNPVCVVWRDWLRFPTLLPQCEKLNPPVSNQGCLVLELSGIIISRKIISDTSHVGHSVSRWGLRRDFEFFKITRQEGVRSAINVKPGHQTRYQASGIIHPSKIWTWIFRAPRQVCMWMQCLTPMRFPCLLSLTYWLSISSLNGNFCTLFFPGIEQRWCPRGLSLDHIEDISKNNIAWDMLNIWWTQLPWTVLGKCYFRKNFSPPVALRRVCFDLQHFCETNEDPEDLNLNCREKFKLGVFIKGYFFSLLVHSFFLFFLSFCILFKTRG